MFGLRRKAPDGLPRRSPSRIKVAGACTTNKDRRVDDGGVVMSDEVEDKNRLADYHRPFLFSEYPLESFGYVGRESEEGRFAKSQGVGNKHNIYNDLGPVTTNEYFGNSVTEAGRDRAISTMSGRLGNEYNLGIKHGPVISKDHSGYLLGEIRQASDDGRFAETKLLECNHNVETTECCSFRQPYLHSSVYPNKAIVAADTVAQDQLRPLPPFLGSIEPQIAHHSNSTLYGDSLCTSMCTYDPGITDIDFRCSSSSGIDKSYNSVRDCASPYSTHANNLIPTLKDQSYPKDQSYFSYVGPKSIKRCADDISGLGNPIPFSPQNYCDNFWGSTTMPRKTAAYPENVSTDFSEKQGFLGLSFSKSPLAAVPLSETGSGVRENNCPSSYSSGLNIYNSLNLDYGFAMKSQRKLDQEVARHGFNSLLSYDLECYQDSDKISSGCETRRKSVFSRLSLATDASEEENGDDIGHEAYVGGTSVDEVMAMLRQSHCQLTKTKKAKPSFKGSDNIKNFRYKKQTNFCPKLENDCFEMNSEEMNTNGNPTFEDNVSQIEGTPVDCKHLTAEGTPYVNFKRRSEIQKTHNDMKRKGSDIIAGNDGSSGAQQRRRKLIRPNFSKEKSSNDLGINADVSQSIDVVSDECSVASKDKQESSEDKTGNCEDVVGSRDEGKKLSQTVELPHVICPIRGEYKDGNVERGLNFEGELREENRVPFFRVGGEDTEESLQDAGIRNACEDKC